MSSLDVLFRSMTGGPGAETAGTPSSLLLHGLGGCGKSSVGLELAHRATAKGVQVWWIDKTDPAALAGGMRAVGRRLGLSDEEMHLDEFPDLLWDRLNAHTEPWLLLIDGVDDPESLAIGYPFPDGRGWVRPLRAGARGLVVVTSRNGSPRAWGRWWTRYLIDVLDNRAGGQLLLDHAAAGTMEEAEALAGRLGGLALALWLAGSYLGQTTTAWLDDPNTVSTFVDYRSQLEQGNLELFDVEDGFSPKGDQRAQRIIIGHAWELSLDLIERRGQRGARALLRLLACFASADVPYKVLLETPVLAESAIFAGQAIASLSKVLGSLADFGLVGLSAARDHVASSGSPGHSGVIVPVLRIHPLVRDTSRDHLDHLGETGQYIALVCAMLASAVSRCDKPDKPEGWPVWQVLGSHCAYVLDLIASTPLRDQLPSTAISQAADAAHEAARYLCHRGLYEQAATSFRALVAFLQTLTQSPFTAILRARNGYAAALREDARGRSDMNLLQQAEAEFRAVYESQRAILGERDDDTLETLCDLAITIAYQKRSAEAKELYQIAYDRSVAKFGERHPVTLNCRLGLAIRLLEEHQHDAAEGEFRAVYEMNQQLPDLGPDHPDTLVVRGWLASVLRERGRLAEAEAEYRFLVAADIRLHGPDHPVTLVARGWLAALLREQGRLADAEVEYRALVAADNRVYGADGKTTFNARSALGYVLWQSGQFAEAEREYRALVGQAHRIYGSEGKQTVDVRAVLAMVLRAAGKLDDAETEYRLVADADSRLYGPDDKATVNARVGLAGVLRQRGALVEAEREYRTILEVVDSSSDLGDYLPVVRNLLANVLIQKGRQLVQSAGAAGDKEVEMMSDVQSVADPQWFQLAISTFREALGLIDAEASPGFYGVVMHDIAAAQVAAGKYRDGAATYEESARYKRLGGNKDDLIITLMAMSECLIGGEQPAAAKATLDEAGKILADTELGRRGVRLYRIGQAYEMVGMMGQEGARDRALACYRETLELLDAEAEPVSYATVLHSLGDVCRAANRLKEAVDAYQQAVGYLREHSADSASFKSYLIDLGRTLVEVGKAESSDAEDDNGSPADFGD
jgi:tetratricopeptide (TPR) repeat protein